MAWEWPMASININITGATNMLESIYTVKIESYFYKIPYSTDRFELLQETPQIEKENSALPNNPV